MTFLWFAIITLYIGILLVIEIVTLGAAFLLSVIFGVSFSYVTIAVTVAVSSAVYYFYKIIRGLPEIKKNVERYAKFKDSDVYRGRR